MLFVTSLKSWIARLVADENAERVTAVDGDTVTTMRGGIRTRYLNVRGSYSVGDIITEPVKHRSHGISVAWSPWDGVLDDD